MGSSKITYCERGCIQKDKQNLGLYNVGEAIGFLYKVLVTLHLECANYVWNSYRIGLIKDIEKGKTKAAISVIKISKTIGTLSINGDFKE